MNESHDNLQEIMGAALRKMGAKQGNGFNSQRCKLAQSCGRTKAYSQPEQLSQFEKN